MKKKFESGISFSEKILGWYEENGRNLPWRETSDPYRIWLSEVILQQTRVEQGYAYYLRFLERFPNVEILADAEEDEVMQLWQGLGYYSRARNFHAAAKMIKQWGAFPEDYGMIRQLPGVGDYTAAAIASFAFGKPYAAVDGNVYRVLSRYFALEEAIDTPQGKRLFAELANELLAKDAPAAYNSALMDFGALQCTPKNPLCTTCPLVDSCLAFSGGNVSDFPRKLKKAERRTRYFVYMYLHSDDRFCLHKRGAGDIWQGLYEPLLLEFENQPEEKDIFSHPLLACFSGRMVWKSLLSGFRHNLTHRQIVMSAYDVRVSDLDELPEGYFSCPLNQREEYPHSRLVSIVYEAVDAQTESRIS